MATRILPPNSTLLERSLAAAGEFTSEASINAISTLWNPQTCPAHVLPWLAWALSVDMWDDAWPEERKRAVVAGSLAWHRRKGTPWAVKQALANIGYPVVNLVEYRTYYEEWIAAGGRTLDGSWPLDGELTLDPPEGAGDVRKMALSHWAEYAIRINIADGPWSREQQRAIRRTAEAYAPARSHLRSIITSGSVRIAAPIRLIDVRQSARTRFDKCKRAPVHRWSTLDGCWTLSGGYSPRRLDGAWPLQGDIQLTGQRPEGPALDSSFATFATRARSVLPIQAAGGDRINDPGALSPPAYLDGSLNTDGRKTDGNWPLDASWSLDYPTLNTFGLRKLDGTWNLGRTTGRPGVWFSTVVTTRRGGVVTREVI